MEREFRRTSGRKGGKAEPCTGRRGTIESRQIVPCLEKIPQALNAQLAPGG